jgi:hypothetical protein
MRQVARNRVLAVVMSAVLVAAALGACGSSGSKNTPEEVQAALKSTASQSAVELTLSLQGSQSAFSNSSGSGLTPAQEQAILDSTLALTVHAAKGTSLAHAGTGGELALTLAEGGTTLVELRLVGSTLFARVDIQKLTDAYGLDKGKVAQFRSQLQRLGSQVQGLSALDEGKWVSLDIKLISQFAAAAGVTLPSVPQLVAQTVGAFFNTLSQSTDITSIGNNKAQMTVNAQQLVTALGQAVASTPGMSTLSKQAKSLSQRAHNAVPAGKSANVVVTVGAGIISNLAVPLNQFDTSKQLKGPASANLAVATAGSVSAPSGAVAINLPQLLHAFEGTPANS